MRVWELWRMPARAVALLLSLHIATLAVVVLAVREMVVPTAGQFSYALVAVLGVVWARTHATLRAGRSADVYERSGRIQHSSDDCWISALAIGASLGAGVLAVLAFEALTYLVHWVAFRAAPQRWRAPQKPSRLLFSVSSNGLAVAFAHTVFAATGGGSTFGLRAAAAAALAILCLQLATHGALIAVMHLAAGIDLRRLLHDEFHVALAQVSQKALGVLIWASWAQAPWTILFAFPLLLSFERAQRHAALLEQAQTDTKTGIANAAHWRSRAEHMITQARGLPAVVALIDLDHFKVVNDTFGHAAGDVVLRQTADRIQQAVRPGDVVGRFGGEEFTVLLGRATLEEAHAVAERVRSLVAGSPIPCETPTGTAMIPITCSIGISEIEPQEQGALTAALARADLALYRAKRQGRNRTEVAPRAVVAATPVADGSTHLPV